jgi:hypothetical protein
MARTYQNVSTLPFIVDPNSIMRDYGGQIDWAYVRRDDSVTVTANGVAAQAATSMTVDALSNPIPSGAILTFGSGEFAKLTAAAAKGATSLTVEALVNAIEDDDVATYVGTGIKSLSAGKVMARLAGGKLVPRGDRPGSETAVGLLASGASENSQSDALTGYGLIVGGVIYENMLIDAVAGVLPSAYKTEMQTAGVGTGFAFRAYSNSLD